MLVCRSTRRVFLLVVNDWDSASRSSLRALGSDGSMLEECVVKVVNEWKREVFAKTTYASKGPEVTLRPSWVHARSNTASMPRETESKLQMWDFDPIPSESRNWPNEELQGRAVHATN